ncbi:hypothetical protein ES703_60766 [subsurface metagenome]
MKCPVLDSTNVSEHRGWASRIAGWILLSITFLIVFPISLSAQVDTVWVRRYNGPGNIGDYAHAIAVDDHGYVYITGGSWGSGTSYDYATIKYYPNGDIAWVRRYNGPTNGSDEGDVLAVDNSGNVYVTGYSGGPGPYYDCATIKYYPNGDTAWVRRYNGPASYSNEAFAIAVDNLGNVYITCESEGYGTYADYATIKYYANGDTAWVRRYNGPGNGSDVAHALAADSAGNVYVTGGSHGSGTSLDYATIKYYASGDTAWIIRYNGPGNWWDDARAIAIDNSCNVYVTGESQGLGGSADYVTIKYYASGDTAWIIRYNGPGNWWDDARAIAVDNTGNVYVTGHGEGSYQDYATIKYVQTTSINEDSARSIKQGIVSTTIFSGPLQLPEGKKCKVFDITGRVVASDKIQPGIYFVEIDGVVTQKVVKVR